MRTQQSPWIAEVVQPVGINSGFVLRGQRFDLFNTTTPEATPENANPVDLTFCATTVADNLRNLTIRLTITNHDSRSITITNDDLLLTAAGQAPFVLVEVVPPLNLVLLPEASLLLVITFTNPGEHSAVLQVLDIAIDLYY